MRWSSRSLGRWTLAALVLVAGCAADSTSKLGTLSGNVTDDVSAALVGVEVTTEPSTGTVVTDAGGAYALTGVAAGTYLVKGAKSGYEPAAKQAVLAEGATAYVDLKLVKIVVRGAIAGKVTHQGSTAAVVGASVTTTPTSAEAITGPDGTYRLADVAVGTYAVKVTATGFNTVEKAGVKVTAGATTTTDVQMVAVVVYNSTCEQCHLDSELLVADLTADPPPEAAASGSVGEG